ncbi:3-hydroxyacyl-ACP dehydratase FabZ [Candidatus Hepatincolaceae symbiont of Richtersius coronifer]
MNENKIEDDKFELDINGIKKLIPHRYPFLLVDKIVAFRKDEYVESIKNVTINEEFFQGHFPNFPIMPGVLIVEALAQTSAIFYLLNLGLSENNKVVYFMAVDECKFRKPVSPGDTLKLRISYLNTKGKISRVKGAAYVGETLVCQAILTAMVGN